ncbi:MAG: hypothetical protein Q8L08_04765 [Candidatus Nanopelagicaceae bacterium]|nr:hypothetical protein [Candidatus Nanopelagicaceae bacterium]
MAERKRKFRDPNGNEIDGIIMPFQAGGEYWNEYLVEDGTVVKIKLVVSEVLRLDGQFDPNTGDPIYIIQSTNITNVSAPENLRKKS